VLAYLGSEEVQRLSQVIAQIPYVTTKW